MNKEWMELIERVIYKITSGTFIFTVVVAGVYAFLACTGQLDEARVNEITLVVLYAYFNRPRPKLDKEQEDIQPEVSSKGSEK